MIRSCMLTRKELTDLVLKSPQTEDGIYFCPRIRDLILQDGPNNDGEYYYDRYLFKGKICWSITDIKIFLAKQEMEVDTDLITIMDQKMEDALEGLEMLHLRDKVPQTDYTLEELIDTCVFIVREKYA